MGRKKSVKQLLKEQEDEFNRKKGEFETEFSLMIKGFEDSGLERFVKNFDRENWVSQKLEEWKSQQPLIIKGKYQDRKKIVAIYKQRFIEFTRQFCPEIIEELRNLVPLFDKVFGDNKDNFISLFNWDKMQLFNLNQSLNSYIYSLMMKSENPLYPLLQFRPYKADKFRYDYTWGEYYVLLHFLYWLFPFADEGKTNERFNNTLELITHLTQKGEFDLIVGELEKLITAL